MFNRGLSTIRGTRLLPLVVLYLGMCTPPVYAASCEQPEHRAFDFWLGDWQVHTPDGELAGYNHIEREYGGCVIHERYTSVRDFRGESLNIYDATRGIWHQTWVDNSGQLLILEGGIIDGNMVLEGETAGDNGSSTRQRITWTANPDGSVRQLWESRDAGPGWTVVFDGLYTRR